MEAAKRGDVVSLQKLLLSGVNPSAEVGEHKSTALHAACSYNRLASTQALLLAKAAVDARDEYGRTPLHFASLRAEPEIVETLCEAGANVDARDEDEYTPLMLACKYEDREKIIEMLLAKGANVHSPDAGTKSTALHFAAASGGCKNITMLLDKGADIEARSHFNNTPLHLASCSDQLDAVQVLIQRGADIFSRGEYDKTALEQTQSSEIVSFLLEQYKERIVSSEGDLSLHAILEEAAYSESTEVNLKIGELAIDRFVSLLESILLQEPDWIRSQDRNHGRDLPIHVACRTNAPLKILRFLVKQDPVTLYLINSHGCLPIHEACRCGEMPLEKIKYLVATGGEGTLCARDTRCALPLHVSCESKPPVEVVKYLLKMHPKSVSEKTSEGALPFMLATECEASADVLHVLLTAHPDALAVMKKYYSLTDGS